LEWRAGAERSADEARLWENVMKKTRLFCALLLLAATAAAAQPSFAQLAVPNPVVSGPITGGVRGTALMASYFDLGTWGYLEQEFFTEGTATAYAANPQTSAPYKTRVIVRRPVDPQRFNGTVYVERAALGEPGPTFGQNCHNARGIPVPPGL